MKKSAEFRYESEDISSSAGNTICDKANSADELRECTRSTRASIDQNLRELEERLAPGWIWDRLRRRLGQESGSFDLGQIIDRNPAPFIIVGTGLALIGTGIAAYALTKRQGNGFDGQEEGEYPAPPRDVTMEEFGLDHGSEPIVTPPPEGEPEHVQESANEPGVTSAAEVESIQGIEEAEAYKEEFESQIASQERKAEADPYAT